jgi:hypothetical protein
MAGLVLAVFALLVIGASAVSFADQARKGGVDRQLLGAHAWGEPSQSVRDDVYEELKAIPGGPYKAKRGGPVTLDGSASKPKKRITSYSWTFESHCPGGAQAHNVSLSGPQVKIDVVCATTATLTVSDGQTSDAKSTTIKVSGKLPAVKFHQPKSLASANFPFDTAAGTLVFGFNRCRVEWNQSHDPDLVDHWLHRPDDGREVETDEVFDPGGPYDGFFYVTDHNLVVTRKLLINRKLLKHGEVYNLNKAKHKDDIEMISEAVHDHERIHGELVRKALKSKKLDFLDRLAKVVDTTDEGVQSQADLVIGDGETELKSASTEAKVHRQMTEIWGGARATIIRPSDGSTHTYKIAKIGDASAQ